MALGNFIIFRIKLITFPNFLANTNFGKLDQLFEENYLVRIPTGTL